MKIKVRSIGIIPTIAKVKWEFFLVVTATIVFLGGCSNYDTRTSVDIASATSKAVSQGVSLIDGKLKFEDRQALNAYIDHIREIGLETAINSHRNLGFISYFDIMNIEYEDYIKYKPLIGFYDQSNTSLNGKLDSKEAGQYLKIPDDNLTSILSVNKEVQIGDTIYKIERDYLFAYKAGKLSEVEKIKSHIKNGTSYSSPHVAVYPLIIERYKIDSVTGKSVLVETNRPIASNKIMWGGLWLSGFGWRTTETGWEYYKYEPDVHHKFQVEQSEVNLLFWRSHDVNAYTKKDDLTKLCFLWWCWKDWIEKWDRVSYIKATTQGKISLPRSGAFYDSHGRPVTAYLIYPFDKRDEYQSNTFDYPYHEALGLRRNFVIGIGFSSNGVPGLNLNIQGIFSSRSLLKNATITGVSTDGYAIIEGWIEFSVHDQYKSKLNKKKHKIDFGVW